MRNIMIVEDEPEVRSVIYDFVSLYFEESATPCEIEALDDSMEALFRLSDVDHHYDAILLDVRMPGLGGDDIYQAIDAMGGDVARHVLFITGFSDDLLNRYKGCDLQVLNKPFTFSAFSSAMNKLLHHDTPSL